MLNQEWVRIVCIIFIFIVVYINLKQDYKIKRLNRRLQRFRQFEKSEAFEMYLERVRQVEEEGYDIKGDKVYYNLGELAGASASYLESYLNNQPMYKEYKEPPIFIFKKRGGNMYPWNEDKREQKTQRRKLIVAGALILSELKRIKE